MHYYMHDGPAAFRFELAGELDSNDAARLEQDWRVASSVVGNRTLIIDMSFVTSIDDTARNLFRRWHARGAQFAAKSRGSRELVESITGRLFLDDPPNPPTYRSWFSLLSNPLKVPLVTLVALVALFAPLQLRGNDDGVNLAFARFLAHSAQVNEPTTPDDMTVEIEAVLPQLDKRGDLEVIRHRGAKGAMEYAVVKSEGDSMVRRQVIARYLAIEQQAFARPASLSAITPANYSFRYAASIEGGGNQFYVFAIKPRHRGDGLLDGQIWIDAATGAVVHHEGRLVKPGSKFVRKIEIAVDAGARVESPDVRVTRVDIDTRWFGRAKLTIRERSAVLVQNTEDWQ